MNVRTALIGVSLMAAVTGNAFADALTLISDKAFIDNRPMDDPLATGLNLNLGIVVMDSVGGGTALLAGTQTFTSSNASYPLGHTLFGSATGGVADFGMLFDVTPAQFAVVTGTFTFTITDANGTLTDTTHPLDSLEVLAFPTNLTLSDHSTTPLLTLTDTNAAAPAGTTRIYDVNVYDSSLNSITTLFSLTPSIQITSGILLPGNQYDFRVEIRDIDTAEFLAGGAAPHDPTESRSDDWIFNFTPTSAVPEPSSWILLGTCLLGLARLTYRKIAS